MTVSAHALPRPRGFWATQGPNLDLVQSIDLTLWMSRNLIHLPEIASGMDYEEFVKSLRVTNRLYHAI